jgi:HEAT repeat protein
MSPQHASAAKVCGSLHRAYRELRLYPPGHPTARDSLEDLTSALGEYLEQWGPLVLKITQDALTVDEEVVYQHETSRDNLAFLFFRDGIRSLSVVPGCGAEELEALVDCVAHADDLASQEQDLVTALWERDLSHVDYQTVDPFLGGGVLQEGAVDALRETVHRRLEIAQAPGVSAADLARVDMRAIKPKPFDSSILRLTEEEMERGDRAIDDLASVLPDYGEVLLEIAGKVFITAASDVLIQSMAAVVAAYLDDDDLGAAALVLERLGQLEAQRWCPAGSVGFVVREAITAAHVRHLLPGGGQAPSDRSRGEQDFLKSVRRWITPSLLEILTETGDRSVRKTVLDILGGENAVPWEDVEPLLRDPRWYVVRNAVHLAAGIGHDELIDHAPRLLAHPDVRVRREMVRALGRIGGRKAMTAVAKALADGDPSVRILAASAVGRRGGSEQAGLLLARIQDRTFISLSREEIEAFMGAYAELAQERAVPLLARSFKRSVMVSRPPALRVAAVLALGRVRGPAAHAALQAAAKSGDPQVRRAAADAGRHTSTPQIDDADD